MSRSQERLQDALTSFEKDLEKSIRPMQKEMFLCTANAYSQAASSSGFSEQQLQQTIQNCHAKLQHAEQIQQHEIQSFQQRLQRCAQVCFSRAILWALMLA
jgi:hypothetical protein